MLLSCCFREQKEGKAEGKSGRRRRRNRNKDDPTQNSCADSQEQDHGQCLLSGDDRDLIIPAQGNTNKDGAIYTVHSATVRQSSQLELKLAQEKYPPSKEAKRLLKQRSQESVKQQEANNRASRTSLNKERPDFDRTGIPYIDQSPVEGEPDLSGQVYAAVRKPHKHTHGQEYYRTPDHRKGSAGGIAIISNRSSFAGSEKGSSPPIVSTSEGISSPTFSSPDLLYTSSAAVRQLKHQQQLQLQRNCQVEVAALQHHTDRSGGKHKVYSSSIPQLQQAWTHNADTNQLPSAAVSCQNNSSSVGQNQQLSVKQLSNHHLQTSSSYSHNESIRSLTESSPHHDLTNQNASRVSTTNQHDSRQNSVTTITTQGDGDFSLSFSRKSSSGVDNSRKSPSSLPEDDDLEEDDFPPEDETTPTHPLGGGLGFRGLQRSTAFHNASLLQEQLNDDDSRKAQEKELESVIKTRLQQDFDLQLEKIRQENLDLLQKENARYEKMLAEKSEIHLRELQEAVNKSKNEENERRNLLMQTLEEERQQLKEKEEKLITEFEGKLRQKDEDMKKQLEGVEEREEAWHQEKEEVLAEVQRLKSEASRMVALLAAEVEEEVLSEERKRNLSQEVSSLHLILEMKNQEVRTLRDKVASQENKIDALHTTQEELKKAKARVEDLEEQIRLKTQLEKQLSFEKCELELCVEKQSKAAERYSQNVEELQWRIRNNFELPLSVCPDRRAQNEEEQQPSSLPDFPTIRSPVTSPEHRPKSTPLPGLYSPKHHNKSRVSMFSVSQEMMEATSYDCQQQENGTTSDFSPTSSDGITSNSIREEEQEDNQGNPEDNGNSKTQDETRSEVAGPPLPRDEDVNSLDSLDEGLGGELGAATPPPTNNSNNNNSKIKSTTAEQVRTFCELNDSKDSLDASIADPHLPPPLPLSPPPSAEKSPRDMDHVTFPARSRSADLSGGKMGHQTSEMDEPGLHLNKNEIFLNKNNNNNADCKNVNMSSNNNNNNSSSNLNGSSHDASNGLNNNCYNNSHNNNYSLEGKKSSARKLSEVYTSGSTDANGRKMSSADSAPTDDRVPSRISFETPL